MSRLALTVSRIARRTVKAILLAGLALLLTFILVVVPNIAMPMQAYAVGTVAPLDDWPTTPQMTGTTGNLAGTFAVSDGIDRLLVVLVCGFDSAFDSGQTFAATYGGRTLTQAVLQNDRERQTWVGYLKETDIATRSGDTVTVTVTGSHTNVVAYVASYSSVDQTAPVTAANGVHINNSNNQTIGGPLTVNVGGYGIYGWSGVVPRTSDTETYTEHSDVDNPGTFNYGVASKAFSATDTTNPTVTWSGSNYVSVSFVTLNADSPYPLPTTTGISPASKTVGDAGVTLTVDGANFVNGVSVVRLDGADRTTTFVSSTKLTATIPASDLTTAGGKSITVFNSAPGGGTSSAQTLMVNKATLTITARNLTKTYGDSLTFLGTEFTTIGLVGTDTVTSVTLISAGTAASAAVGMYDIAPSTAVGTGLSNYNIVYTNGTLTVSQKTLAVNLPFLGWISPDSGRPGDTLDVAIGGTNITGATSVDFGPGVTVNSFVVNSPTQITANITINSTEPGHNDVVVATPSGESQLTEAFSIEIPEEASRARGFLWYWPLLALLAVATSFVLFALVRETKKTAVLEPTPTPVPHQSLEPTKKTVASQPESSPTQHQSARRTNRKATSSTPNQSRRPTRKKSRTAGGSSAPPGSSK